MNNGFRKAICMIVAAVTMFACAACGGDKPTGGDIGNGGDESVAVNCLKDRKYENGFNLHGLNSQTDAGVVKVIDYGTGSSPDWRICQWWSKFNLKDGTETLANDKYSLTDRSKTLEVNRKYGSITLGVDGSEEFASFNATPPQEWPHLLLEQVLDEPVSIADAESITASLDFTLTKNDNLRGGSVGCQAQFAWFIYIRDTNPASEGYGNFLWFGLNIFDSTKLYAPKMTQQDTAGGLGNYIYALGAADFMENRVKVNENNRFSVDILPHIEEALAKAQESGFMLGTSVDDCSIGGMNIGWEVFDRWDESVTIFDMDIVKTVKGE